ncbi:hypothetical protein [Fundidesulfovibrio terrae]|uniref:hypothetical protein n=1 Tax=Fundidesulfovibrio terrae TaxID=2922866 RepID=UPI001FAEF55D|nr:hypothetical protein [Fundidesulfovibrio terrae]
MKDKFDLFFKAALLVLLAILVWAYAEGRSVGRYAYFRDGELEYVLDTSTGMVYQGGYAMNHLTGQEGPVVKKDGARQ